MSKLLFLILALVVSSILWAIRRARARTRVREIDEGKRCVCCDGTQMTVEFDKARCQQCGHAVSLSWLQKSALTEAELRNVTNPDNRRTL